MPMPSSCTHHFRTIADPLSRQQLRYSITVKVHEGSNVPRHFISRGCTQVVLKGVLERCFSCRSLGFGSLRSLRDSRAAKMQSTLINMMFS